MITMTRRCGIIMPIIIISMLLLLSNVVFQEVVVVVVVSGMTTTTTTSSSRQWYYPSIITKQCSIHHRNSQNSSSSALAFSKSCTVGNNKNNNIGKSNTIYHRRRNIISSSCSMFFQIKKNRMIVNNNRNHEMDDSTDNETSTYVSNNKAKISFQGRTISSSSSSSSTTSDTNNTRNDNNNSNSNSRRLRSDTNLVLLSSPIDRFIRVLTSEQTSLLVGSLGIVLLLMNRFLTFPDVSSSTIEDDTRMRLYYEASRSRIDLLGVFAAGSAVLNGITKLDVESVRAEQVALVGTDATEVIWDVVSTTSSGTTSTTTSTTRSSWTPSNNSYQVEKNNTTSTFLSIVEWALLSYRKCTPAKTAVLLARRCCDSTQHADNGNNNNNDTRWMTLARVGILPSESYVPRKTPILDRMFSEDGSSIKGGTVDGTDTVTLLGSSSGEESKNMRNRNAKESYLPTLQALPGKVEFTYLPSNAQEALILPVSSSSIASVESSSNMKDSILLPERWQYVVVLGGDVAKSFAPRDIAWCKEIASWIGEVL